MKPLYGPPAPDPTLAAAVATLDSSPDPVVVAAHAIVLHELAGRVVPMGGGYAIPSRATELAVDIVGELDRRGFLTPQGRLW